MNPKQREALYDRCRDGRPYALCNLCGLPVYPGDAWDESHFPIPKALGGTETGIAHLRCNRDHGAKIVTPTVAKAKRVRQKHIGARERGKGYRPMPCGRRSAWKKKISGEVVKR